jgi:hypothetical protein
VVVVEAEEEEHLRLTSPYDPWGGAVLCCDHQPSRSQIVDLAASATTHLSCLSNALAPLATGGLTPDQIRPSEVWEVDDGANWIVTLEAQVRRQ